MYEIFEMKKNIAELQEIQDSLCSWSVISKDTT